MGLADLGQEQAVGAERQCHWPEWHLVDFRHPPVLKVVKDELIWGEEESSLLLEVKVYVVLPQQHRSGWEKGRFKSLSKILLTSTAKKFQFLPEPRQDQWR